MEEYSILPEDSDSEIIHKMDKLLELLKTHATNTDVLKRVDNQLDFTHANLERLAAQYKVEEDTSALNIGERDFRVIVAHILM